MIQANNRGPLLDLIEAQASLDNRFINIRRIGLQGGNGNFSLVFTATDKSTGETVAVKVFDPFEKDAYRIECFKREADILGQLRGQKGILELVSPRSEFVQVLQPYGFSVPVSYFVVELADSDVDALIEQGQLDSLERLEIFREMCRAVQRIHSRGIAHRDVKPSNFLRLSNGAIKLSDFGTARIFAEQSILRDYTGTPPGDIGYTAPELLASLHDEQPQLALCADVFSLGATLFELITGTMLIPNIFDARFQNDLLVHMAAVPRGRRVEIFGKFVQSIANARPLPDIRTFSPQIASCIVPIANDLYQQMAALDYRKRLSNFQTAFLKIEQCRLVLRNELKLRKWREQKVKFQEAADKKRERIAIKFARPVIARTI